MFIRLKHLHQFRLADDHAEDVVEIVGDAAGKGADRLHFLRLDELLFQKAGFGDVPGIEGNPLHHPVSVSHREVGDIHEPPAQLRIFELIPETDHLPGQGPFEPGADFLLEYPGTE